MSKDGNDDIYNLHRYLVDEVIEDYQEGSISRRSALQMLASLIGATMAIQLLDGCATKPKATSNSLVTSNQQPSAKSPLSVAIDDPAVVAEKVEFKSGNEMISGYIARPAQGGVKPIILVCHENRGLTLHIEDVTRRIAKAGYVAIAVDLLSREGGTAKFKSDEIPGVLGKAPAQRFVQDFQAALSFVRTKSYARSADPGMIGFCFGGGVAWRSAVAISDLRAVVPFYGPPAAPEDIAKIRASVLAIYAAKDARINAMIPDAESAMNKNKKVFEKVIYPDADHGFNNDTSPRYNETAALQSWEKAMNWFNVNLRPEA